jgi:TonB family protein
MNLRAVILLTCILGLAHPLRADVVAARKAFARQLDSDVIQAKVKKVYVADFTDESGKFSVLGRFFAATFAQLLNERSMGYSVVDRAGVRRSLSKSGQPDQQPADPGALAKVLSGIGADAILWGKISITQNVATIDVVMRTLSSENLVGGRYQESLDGELKADLEASQSGSIFYYAGLDGVSPPKCLQCPMPYWPVGQGSPSREGNVILSILVTPEGTADQMRVAQSLDPVFDKAALECVRDWRFEPSRDAEGNVVPVRLPVQITFKRRWRLN